MSTIRVENHDLNSINWVSGLSDPGEMIGCGMYQQLRRRQGEQDRAYQLRITAEMEQLPAAVRLKITTAMVAAARKRAALDTSNGRANVMVAGELPWHGLGVNVAEATTSEEAAKLSGLANWHLAKQPLYYFDAAGTKREAQDVHAVVRQDTGAMLGSVGNFYKPIQNEEGFAFLDGVLEQFGARYESAGSLYGGKKVWMLAHLPEQAFTINGGDEVQPYVIFTNCHDGSGAAFAYPTSVRVVCANTFRTSTGGRGKGISIRHTGSVADKIADAQEVLGLAVGSFEGFKSAAEVLYAKPLRVETYTAAVLDAVVDVTAEQMKMGAEAVAKLIAKNPKQVDSLIASIQKKIDRRQEVYGDIMHRYEGERCGIGSIRGTAWAAFNAVTEHADHNRLTKAGTWRRSEADTTSRRFESIISGDLDDMKQVAFELAMSMSA